MRPTTGLLQDMYGYVAACVRTRSQPANSKPGVLGVHGTCAAQGHTRSPTAVRDSLCTGTLMYAGAQGVQLLLLLASSPLQPNSSAALHNHLSPEHAAALAKLAVTAYNVLQVVAWALPWNAGTTVVQRLPATRSVPAGVAAQAVQIAELEVQPARCKAAAAPGCACVACSMAPVVSPVYGP
jgi:hypothetical protein